MTSKGARGRTPFVGLTGGIAAGKSEALAALRRLGAETLSTDAVAHELLSEPEMRAELVERLGPGVVSGGEVDRDAVAAAIFERPDDREWLEERLWPLVGLRVARWRDDLDRRDPRPALAVVEVPLLFEAGMEDVFDATVAVIAKESVRAERAGTRGHAGLESRTARQLDQSQKAERADYVVENEGDLADLARTLSRLVARMTA